MKNPPKTLQIFLPEGSPAGIRVAELTTRIVQAVAIPRTRLKEFFERDEANHIGTYFLFGGDDDSTKPIAYIGQTEDLRQRLKSHDAKKEFWSTVVVIISRTHSFTQAHIRWLEWQAISVAKSANRYRLNNANEGAEPFVTEPIRADLEEIFETASLLIESIGYPIFRPILEPIPTLNETDEEEWFLKGLSATAKGLFSSSGFVVLEGSKCRAEFAPSAAKSSFNKKRQGLINAGILKREEDSYVFTENYEFKSPSGAAAIVLARHANGWKRWKNIKGQSLREVKRTGNV